MDADEDPVRAGLAAHLGELEAEELLDKILGFSNLPNTVKGMAKRPGAPATEAAALAVVEDPALADALGRVPFPEDPTRAPTTEYFWGLLTLAARADIGALDRLEESITGQDFARKLVATVRRAATKHAAAPSIPTADTAPSDSAGPDVPQKVSEVKRWLAGHTDTDPAVLAPSAAQRAAARVAAIRALGSIGTPGALEVLERYAQDSYPDAVLKELHTAWGRFDRREFATTMFRQGPGTLDLGMAATIEGIGAVPGLTSLEVVLVDGADLSPLAECTDLTTLRVGAEGPPGLLGVEPLRDLPELIELHLTRTTRNADLTPLADLEVRRLRIDLDGADGSFLLAMPRLESVLVSAGDVVDGQGRALGHVAVELARRGVQVVAYRHERSWIEELVQQSAADDVLVVEKSGYVALTADPSSVERLERRLFGNVVP